MLVMCQRFGDLFLFGLVWQYSSIQKNIMKVGSKPTLLTCISNITLSLPSLYFSESKRELNFCNGYLSLLYFWAKSITFQSGNSDLLYKLAIALRTSGAYQFFVLFILFPQNGPYFLIYYFFFETSKLFGVSQRQTFLSKNFFDEFFRQRISFDEDFQRIF